MAGILLNEVNYSNNGDNNSSVDSSKLYSIDDTTSTELTDTDYIPFYDTSATAKKKTLWSNIKSKLKTYFDTLYPSKTTVPDPTASDATKFLRGDGSWQEIQGGSGGVGGGHTIEDPEGTALTQRDTLQFGGDLEVSDDGENEKTVVAPHELTAAELAEIVTPLPSVPVNMPILFDETGTERVVGWYRLANGTKKPVYEKSFAGTANSTSDFKTIGNIGSDCQAVNITGGTLVGHIPINYSGTSSWYTQCYITQEGNIQLGVAGYYNQAVIINVQYTKTADTPT